MPVPRGGATGWPPGGVMRCAGVFFSFWRASKGPGAVCGGRGGVPWGRSGRVGAVGPRLGRATTGRCRAGSAGVSGGQRRQSMVSGRKCVERVVGDGVCGSGGPPGCPGEPWEPFWGLLADPR